MMEKNGEINADTPRPVENEKAACGPNCVCRRGAKSAHDATDAQNAATRVMDAVDESFRRHAAPNQG